MSLSSPTMNASWADEVDEVDEVDEELHPSIPRDGDKYDRLGRNLSAQARREKSFGRWTTVKYSKKFY